MKLEKWLKDNGMTCQSFAEKRGASRSGVWKIASGFQRPNWPTMLWIYKETGKRVTPNDFL